MKKIISLLSILTMISCQSNYNISNIDWNKVECIQAEKENANIFISCKADKNGKKIWEKTFYYKLKPIEYYYKTIDTPDGKVKFRHKKSSITYSLRCSDGYRGNYYNDASRIGTFSPDNFTLFLDIAYGDRSTKVHHSIQKSFLCKWVEYQEIQKDDIKLIVKIKNKPGQNISANVKTTTADSMSEKE